MQLLKNIHSIIDYALALLKLVQNREVGWRTLNRKTGKYEREQQPLFKKLKLLLLFNPITEWIDRTHLLRLWNHEKTIAAGETRDFDISFWKMVNILPQGKRRPPKPVRMRSRPLLISTISIWMTSSRQVLVNIPHADSRVVVYPSVSQLQALWIQGATILLLAT